MIPQTEKLQIIIPIYNEEDCVRELVKRLICLREKIQPLVAEFIFVNDGSQDKSLEMLYGYAEKHDFVKIINLSRNFGHQYAITAGLDYADADYAVTIDADLQDPPELIETMLAKAKEGFDIVYAHRSHRKEETVFKKLSAKFFYRAINKMCNIKIPIDTGDYRLIRKNVLNVLKQMREKHRFLRGMVPWMGFRSTPVCYKRDRRYAGKTKYPFGRMLLFAMDAIFSFSNVPIRVAIVMGAFFCLFGIIASLVLLYLRFFTSFYAHGILTVIAMITIFGGFQLFMIGIMGEYIGRIFEESKRRPLYIISDTRNFVNEPKSVLKD
ncbi:glycosyltransferase family 2 protein [Candidatus Omnitrophota bacterium]